MKKGYLFLLFIFLLIAAPTSMGQDAKDNVLKIAKSISNKLVEEGFQHISIRWDNYGYQLGYENRLYRFEPTALKRVIELTAPILLDNNYKMPLQIVTHRNSLPIICTKLTLDNDQFSVQSIDRFIPPKKQVIVQQENPSTYRAELVLRPYFSAEYGNRYSGDPITHLFDLRPKLNLYLWKGAHFTFEYILPISSEFKETAPQWSKARNRIIALTQQFRLPHNQFLNLSAGVFSRNRYGIAVATVKYLEKRNWFFTGKIGYTGNASSLRNNRGEIQKGWIYTDLNYLDYQLGVHYWMLSTNTQFSWTYGKALNDRTALAFKVVQKFKEVDLGFFAFKTDQGYNYGMELAIPIFPKKYWKPKRFSIRPARQWTYQYLSEVNLARRHQAQGMFDDFPQDLNPNFVQFYLSTRP